MSFFGMILRYSEPTVTFSEIDGSLERMQKIVGGWIEPIQLPNGCLMYVNEEGRILDLPKNPLASVFCAVSGRPYDHIYGNAIVLGVDEEGQEADVPLVAWSVLQKCMAIAQRIKEGL